MPSTVSELLLPEQINLDLQAATEEEAIKCVAELLRENSRLKDFRGFCEALFSREKLSPTALGSGVAFPHARTDSVTQLVAAVGRSRDGVWFQNCPEKVHFVFVIGTPMDAIREYLGLLATLAVQLRQSSIRDELMDADAPERFIEILNRGGALGGNSAKGGPR